MMIPKITSSQMARVDALAVKNGLLVMQMMEYAALNIARFIQQYKPGNILILAGKGHNGGDGIAAARHLKNWGYKVNIILAGSPKKLKRTPAHHYNLVKKQKTPIYKWDNTKAQKSLFSSADIIIDSLLGYNIDGNPRGIFKELIKETNTSNKKIVAIDIPSGLDGTTGIPYNPCIKATSTLTLALPKTGLVKKSAKKYIGQIYVADLGIPGFIFNCAGISIPKNLFSKNPIIKLIK